jgi:FkbM family methyltransferase
MDRSGLVEESAVRHFVDDRLASTPSAQVSTDAKVLRQPAAFGKRLVAQANQVARKFGVELRRFEPPENRRFDNWMYYATLLQTALARHLARADDRLEAAFIDYCVQNHQQSKSQIFQDLFVLLITQEKRNGFFVEFGATNGISLSNTALLEKDFGWQGILAEPARTWHKALAQNRACTLEPRCVWSETGQKLRFNEAYSSELSTLDQYTGHDNHAANRSLGRHYFVDTISLNDLLRHHGAPRAIDYISIDTEGSEYPILANFDFAAYDVSVMTVEHNYVPIERERVHGLLQKNGFERILVDYSLFDDWYVRRELLAASGA